MSGTPLLTLARQDFHHEIGSLLTLSEAGIASNADGGNKASRRYAAGVANRIGASNVREKMSGQALGIGFERASANFLRATFPLLEAIRPGEWTIRRIGDKNQPGYTTSKERVAGSIYEQYEHLDTLESIVKEYPAIQSSLGNAYSIAPDVVVTRRPVADSEINSSQILVGNDFGRRSPIRASVQQRQLLHAVISCKWTIRSDRAQNSRSEALNLIRNRKGRVPHISVVTAEPLPGRIASLALGTGDIDCVYHFALNELLDTVMDVGDRDANEMMMMMVDGKRLKDISDLPLDLAV